MCKYGYTLPDGGSILSSRSRRFVGDNAVNLPPSEVDPNYHSVSVRRVRFQTLRLVTGSDTLPNGGSI